MTAQAARSGNMARNYGKKKRHSKAKPSLLSMAPLVPLAYNAMNGYKNAGVNGALNDSIAGVTGYSMRSGVFNPAYAMPFYGTIVGTYVAKKLVAYSGVNRAMKGLPFRL